MTVPAGVTVALASLAAQAGPDARVAAPAPLPAEPPIGGLVWTVVVPAALLAFASLATWLLYRRFSRGE